MKKLVSKSTRSLILGPVIWICLRKKGYTVKAVTAIHGLLVAKLRSLGNLFDIRNGGNLIFE